MIAAVSFDLDGVLVQTERMKAVSYARAAVELCPSCASEQEVFEGFKQVVGHSRQEAAQGLMERFGLEEAARARMAEFGVDAPWKAYVQVRLRIYDQMLADPEIIRHHQWPHAIALLKHVREQGCRVGMTTMSACDVARRILGVLDLLEAFEYIVTIDDVERGKPDPEVYNVLLKQFGLPPKECLAIEDSPAGIRAALGAGLWCISPTTDFTRDAVHAAHLLDERWIVDDRDALEATVQELMRSVQ
jgi:beta-phosphoglucomutase